MRDLDLWRRLAAAPVNDPAITVDDLLALAARPLGARAPFLHAARAWTAAADPARRAAALRVLAGARGVPGVRALVAALADPDDAVRAAALDALRDTARDAPTRYAHALFHPRADVRRAALADVPLAAADLGAYLRADPACADLAAAAPWPRPCLPLAFDLHAAGHLTDADLVAVTSNLPTPELRDFLTAERGRPPAVVEAYLEAAPPTPAPGRDPVDALVAALLATGADAALRQLVTAVAPRKHRPLARRLAAALWSRVTAGARPAAVGACVALDPRVLAAPHFPAALAGAGAAGLVAYGWPVRVATGWVDRLLALPVVRDPAGVVDLAIAAPLAGLYPDRRLTRLAARVGADAIHAALLASDRGWEELCHLPEERPAVDQAWLARVERDRPDRFIALAARSLLALTGPRLARFVDQLPRRHRAPALLAAAAVAADDRLTGAIDALAPRLDRDALVDVLRDLLTRAAPRRGLALALARAVPVDALASAARALDDAVAVALVAAIDAHDGLPWDRELAIATALGPRPHAGLRDWATRIARARQARASVPLPPTRARRALRTDERARIAAAAPGDLEDALRPALTAPVTGLAEALDARAAAPSVAACAALLGCADPLNEVARQLDRFDAGTPAFDDTLDHAVTALWQTATDLPPLAHARLWRWEAHSAALQRWVDAAGGLRAAAGLADALPGRLAARTLWAGLAELVVLRRYRDRAGLAAAAPPELATLCAERVDRPYGRDAARLLVALIEAGVVPVHAVRAAIDERLADCAADTREVLAALVRLDGLPPPPTAPTPRAVDVIEGIRATDDLDALVAWCRDPRPAVVEEAALRLVTLGAPGEARLVALLAELATLAAPAPVLASIALWESASALAAARALAAAAALPPHLQFPLCVGLVAHGDAAQLAGALAAARAPSETPWFRRDDWDALVRHADPLTCALALVDSPHHHAYKPAVVHLLPLRGPSEVGAALRRFLEVDDDRPLALRRGVARRLAEQWRDRAGLPILLEEIRDPSADWRGALVALEDDLPLVLDVMTSAALVGGPRACPEQHLLQILAVMHGRAHGDLAPLHARILDESSTPQLRRNIARLASGRALRVHRVAEVFAWGIRRGRELTGRQFRVHMTGGEQELGHTFTDSDRVFVTPLPLLRGEPHGREIVEGLILHELGHHLYHRGEVADALWRRAHAEGLGHLLNLVADEHLERNLRSVDPGYGDRLKRLAAYAFQHAPQELKLATLLASLRGAAAPALIAADLEVAFDEQAVRFRRGAVIAELDRTGHPLARFARALRLGHGNRHGDPIVAEALALCGKDLRQLDMQGLYDLTCRLADLFGGAAAVAQVFGGPEGMTHGERDGDVFGAGVDDAVLQREVERILDPQRGRGDGSRPPERLQINVNPDERFERITHVERLARDPEAHRALAASVMRHATRLRAHLVDLGLRWEPTGARLRGRALDRTRLRPLVLRNDPRLLLAREPVRRNDLFLATLIDCSSSMTAGDNLGRARRFAAVVAEAVRGLPGVDARFFGFTDSAIYDAGDADRCAITSLRASGGNNDAAALYHAATVAAASPRRARVLVMISDGLPTQCSVAALRGLATQLTRRRQMVCAQVAVRRLEEQCFPRHVLLDGDLDGAVARFGRMIAELARAGLAA